MFEPMTRQWKGLRRGAPGRRFQESYRAARRRVAPVWYRVLSFLLALLALAVGLFFSVMPGPAIVFFALAGGLLAAESLVLARLLDWGEVRLRAVLGWARRRWKRLGWPGRVAVILAGVSLSLATTLLTWHFMMALVPAWI
jgi:hypothetical protein